MTLERIARLEARLDAYGQALAELKREVAQNRQERRDADQILFRKIDGLTMLANRGRGALSVLVTAGGVGGAVLGWFADHLLTR